MSYVRIAPTPVTHIGWGSIEKLADEINILRPDRILIIADPVLQQLGLTNAITSTITRLGIGFDLYTGISAEPKLEAGQQLVDFARSKAYSLVIGFGGGSALDLAKLAAVFTQNTGDVKEYLNLSGSKTLQRKGIPKILIPTTSGTGAEVTNISVLALEHTKDVISNDFLIADVAIVDPQFTMSVPAKVTAATGADALTHAIEAYISINANPYSDGHALQAISLISSSLRDAVADGSNKEARIKMSYGSYLAGLSFFNAGVGAIHALAYPLGGQFHIPHGDSNAVLIPSVIHYIRNSCYVKLAHIYKAMGGNTENMSPEEASIKCIYSLSSLLRDIGIPPTLEDMGIPFSALEQLTADGVQQKRLLARCPMNLTRDDISAIYASAFAGTITSN